METILKQNPPKEQTAKPRKPDWIRVKLPSKPAFWSTKNLISHLKLNTVCEEAQCPNRWECWTKGSASFMIAGDICTRACGFCAVTTAKPQPLDIGEPARLAQAVANMKLNHVVITAVARDDLQDGGAEHFANCIRAVRYKIPKIIVEVLVPDFQETNESIIKVVEAKPEVFNHNIETVRRLTPRVRSPKAKYDRSLAVLKFARDYYDKNCAGDQRTFYTKSGFMLGLGEKESEIIEVMDDLLASGVDILTIGQYLQPSQKHLPVEDYIQPETFEKYGEIAREKGFKSVASAPLVRSSYNAENVFPDK